MRLFVSIDLPKSLAAAIEDVQERFADASGLRFTDPTQAHVTLKFLGEVSEVRLQQVDGAIERAVERAGVEPFTARFEGLGVFPSPEYITVVWFGVDRGETAMTRLHEAVEAETTAIGFDPERHEFTPHVTLARMEHAGGKELVRDIVDGETATVGEMEVSEIRLTESQLTDDGPRYSTVERYPLDSA